MKHAKVTLGPKQATILWAAAARGIDELESSDGWTPAQIQAAEDALDVLTRAIIASGGNPMAEIP